MKPTPSRGLAALLAVGTACSGNRSVFLEKTWPLEQSAVVVLTQLDGRLVERAPRVFEGSNPLAFTIELSGDVRVYVETFTSQQTGGPDLRRCGVRFGGDGGRLPRPAGAWTSDPLPAGGGRASFHPREPDPNLDLRFVRCDEPAPTACDRIEGRSFRAALESTSFERVAFVSVDLAFVAGVDLTTEQHSLWTIDRNGRTVRADMPWVRASPAGLVWDETAGILFALFEDGEIFEVEPSGSVRARLSIDGLAAIGIAGDHRGHAIVFDGTRAFDVEAGSIAPAPRDVTDRFPPQMTALTILDPERMIAIAGGAIVELSSGVWRRVPGGQGIRDSDRTRSVRGTRDLLSFVGENDVRLSEGGSGRFGPIPEPFLSAPSHDGIVIGHGLLAVGGGGRASVWNGRAWCAIDTGAISGLLSVDGSSDGHAALAVGLGTPTSHGPVVTRLAIPELP